jgi:hypothetical protein
MNVGACRECALARARHDDGSNGAVRLDTVEMVKQPVDQGIIEGVELVGAG